MTGATAHPVPPPPRAWYHTIDLPSGPTPGAFDARPTAEAVPWPDLHGKRCLDLATFDGFWAFEMERRGAAEVVALDVPDLADIDYLPRRRDVVVEERTGDGFRHAAAALRSSVTRVEGNVYDLDPQATGRFDVVLLGALLLHLRSPLAALEAARSVTRETFVSVELVDPVTSVLHRRRPVLTLRGQEAWTWSIPNVAGHLAWMRLAGFDVRQHALAVIPNGRGANAGTVHATGRPAHRLAQRLLRLPKVRGGVMSIAVGEPAPGLLEPNRRMLVAEAT